MKQKKLKTLKVCEICGKEIPKDSKLSNKQYKNKRYCSVKCRQKGRSKDMKGKQIKQNNPNWKGDLAEITTFHKRIENEFGKPNVCGICGTNDKSKTYDWACLTGKYEEVNDYMRLCRSCHKKYDLARLGKGLITLKDLPLNTRDKEIISSIAVKHIKRFEESPYCGSYIGEINWIKHFFNLTEDDLK